MIHRNLIGILLYEESGDTMKFIARLLDVPTRFEPPNHVNVVRASRARCGFGTVKGQRHPQVGGNAIIENRPDHAGDTVAFAIDLNVLPDNGSIATVTARP